MLNDTLAQAFAAVMNAERTSKKECYVKKSKLLMGILTLMNDRGYIGAFEDIDDGRGGLFKIHLLGNLNACGVIKPRFSTATQEFEKWEKRFLPAKGFGVLFVSTSKGLMAHDDAKKKNLGGSLIGYCY